MRKILLLILCLLPALTLKAQNRYFTREGNISFFSEAPLENIEAHNNQVSSFINFDTGELAFSVPMKAFTFRKSLMQTHFNENYVESDKYPRSTFKGKIPDIKQVNLQKDGLYAVAVTGELTIHGVTQPVNADGTLEVKNGLVVARSAFTVTPEQFNITIPRLVRANIAKTIRIQVHVAYAPYLAKNAQ
ncbi:MAG: YceI family protein [Adhaeribacter sp.]